MTAHSTTWAPVTIGEVAEISAGFGFPEHLQGKTSGAFPFAKVRDISNACRDQGGRLFSAANYVDQSDLSILKAKPVPAGSTVFAKIGEALRLNRRALLQVDTILDNNCMAVSPRSGLDANYLFRFMTTVDLAPFAVATTVPSIRRGDVSSIVFGLPPAAEQRRIVAKIDRLSARSKRARDELKLSDHLVNRLKQSNLSAAFEDGLSVLRSTELVCLEDVCSSISDGDHQAPPKAKIGIPFITISALRNGKANLEGATRFVPQSYYDALKPSRRPSPNDILFSVTGTIGQTALIRSNDPFVFQRHIAILRPLAQYEPKYLFYLLSSPQLLRQVRAVATGTAQLTVPISGLRKAMVPSATAVEQREIVRRIEHAFAAIDRLAAEAQSARALLDRLDQSILAKAFRGELVLQDPNDEPASVLLERIRAERAAAPGSRKRKKSGADV